MFWSILLATLLATGSLVTEAPLVKAILLLLVVVILMGGSLGSEHR
jgi:hypothetical protein